METAFVLPLNAAVFNSTQGAWNALQLHSRWAIGNVAMLVELKPFADKEEWEAFYYRSGEEREVLLSKWEAPTQAMLQDALLIGQDREFVCGLRRNLRNLNTQFGRTRERLYQLGELLQQHLGHLQPHEPPLTPEECFECVRFRVICQTWNRMVSRKQNALRALQARYPQMEYRGVSAEMAHNYAVDYEAYVGGQLQYALQIKPRLYTGKATYLQNARQANSRKNQLYETRFSAPVHHLLSDPAGKILNPDVLQNI